jgi:hypothetical protein
MPYEAPDFAVSDASRQFGALAGSTYSECADNGGEGTG